MKDTKKVLVEDPRYKQCYKEALIGVAVGIGNLLWWYFFGYGMGSKDPSEYTYVLGFPTWFFMSCIAGPIVVTVVVAILLKTVFKHMSLEALSEEELKEYENAEKGGK